MRLLGITATIAILLFWATMNTLVVLRQRDLRSQNRYRAGVNAFLGTDLLRERWLGIYQKNRKIGYSGYILEKVFADEGPEISGRIESRLETRVLGRQLPVEVLGSFTLDVAMIPIQLRLDVSIGAAIPLTLTGEGREDRFRIVARQGEQTIVELDLPREDFFLGDGLVPSLPVSGFTVGERFSVPCFDPLTLTRSLAEVEVVARETREIGGLPTDGFRLETTFGNRKSTSFVTSTGEVLRQEFGDLVLRRETRENATRFFKR